MNKNLLLKRPLDINFFEYKELRNIILKYNEILKVYKKKFGEESLRFVILPDPYDTSFEAYINYTKKLENSIKNNIPIEQMDEKIFKSIIF